MAKDTTMGPATSVTVQPRLKANAMPSWIPKTPDSALWKRRSQAQPLHDGGLSATYVAVDNQSASGDQTTSLVNAGEIAALGWAIPFRDGACSPDARSTSLEDATIVVVNVVAMSSHDKWPREPNFINRARYGDATPHRHNLCACVKPGTHEHVTWKHKKEHDSGTQALICTFAYKSPKWFTFSIVE